MYIYIYIYICVYIYIHMCMYIHIYIWGIEVTLGYCSIEVIALSLYRTVRS